MYSSIFHSVIYSRYFSRYSQIDISIRLAYCARETCRYSFAIKLTCIFPSVQLSFAAERRHSNTISELPEEVNGMVPVPVSS